ncbi:MAG: mannose-6-phosphate isomerase-like protein (cupin superfamily) [Paracoccaceae bacterium]
MRPGLANFDFGAETSLDPYLARVGVRSPRSEVWTAERCFIRELFNDPGSPEASLAIARVPAGEVTVLHALIGVTERYLIQSGWGRAEVDGHVTEVSAGDIVVIPPGAAQRITNMSRRDLVFLCLCTPRFRPEAYLDLEI